MRSVELAKVAVAAESLYLRRLARRQAMRGVYAIAAGIFALVLLVSLHLFLYQLARLWLAPWLAALAVLVLDAIVTGVLAVFAIRGAPDPVETEALVVRDQAMAELRRSLTAMGMAAELGGLLLRTGARSGIRRGVATAAAEVASRFLGR